MRHDAEGTLSYGGYTSDSGATTQMTDDDRAALAVLSDARALTRLMGPPLPAHISDQDAVVSSSGER